MAALTATPGRSLLARLLAAASSGSRARHARIAQIAALARQHVVTAAALGAFDFGAFGVRIPHLGAAPGWTALALSLLALDFAVRGLWTTRRPDGSARAAARSGHRRLRRA
jgi:hypothetical protein